VRRRVTICSRLVARRAQLSAVLKGLEDHAQGTRANDDRTLLVLKRL